MTDAEPPRYRPVTLWFLGILAVVVALVVAGEWLRRKYG
jgi:hypothetical protein